MTDLILNRVLLREHPGRPMRLEISGGRIRSIHPADHPDPVHSVDLRGAWVIPGLINAHDHLEFNSFPRFKTRLYRDYLDWGKDIHRGFPDEIKRVLSLSVADRQRIGILKNILNGVTTVIDHGKEALLSRDVPLKVFRGYDYLHALGTEKYWRWKLLHPSRKPVMIHLGEGLSENMGREARRLLRWNLWSRRVIAVHLLTAEEASVKKLHGLIWCPDSNIFLYGQTTEIARWKTVLPVMFGTDSCLSASADLWEQLRLARSLGPLDEGELLNAVTATPASVLGLEGGSVSVGGRADLLALEAPSGSLLDSGPEDILLLIKDGRIVLCDDSLRVLISSAKESFDALQVRGAVKHVRGRWRELLREARTRRTFVPFDVTCVDY